MIPKFTLALERKLPLLLHGDGLHTRRYLFASDAADAFDTILHRGAIGSTYNVDSSDELSNLRLCTMLLQQYGHDTAAPGFSLSDHVRHTVDRPFNDRRYAVDATRLRELGWRQKVGFEDGLRRTVAWYRMYGERWWGDVGKVIEGAFPVVVGGVVVSEGESEDLLSQTVGGGDKALEEKAKRTVGRESNGVEEKRSTVNGEVNGKDIKTATTTVKRSTEGKKHVAKNEIDLELGTKHKASTGKKKTTAFSVGDQ